VAIIVTLRSSSLAQAVLVIAALMWLIPDQRIEQRLAMYEAWRLDPNDNAMS
jgi:hypothetical protein